MVPSRRYGCLTDRTGNRKRRVFVNPAPITVKRPSRLTHLFFTERDKITSCNKTPDSEVGPRTSTRRPVTMVISLIGYSFEKKGLPLRSHNDVNDTKRNQKICSLGSTRLGKCSLRSYFCHFNTNDSHYKIPWLGNKLCRTSRVTKDKLIGLGIDLRRETWASRLFM